MTHNIYQTPGQRHFEAIEERECVTVFIAELEEALRNKCGWLAISTIVIAAARSKTPDTLQKSGYGHILIAAQDQKFIAFQRANGTVRNPLAGVTRQLHAEMQSA